MRSGPLSHRFVSSKPDSLPDILARGLGIGTAIMHKITKIALDRGCLNIQWQTPDFNLPAIEFYGRLGTVKKNKVRFSLPLNS
jgi:hypothetical protein